jgi:hypothetical protein
VNNDKLFHTVAADEQELMLGLWNRLEGLGYTIVAEADKQHSIQYVFGIPTRQSTTVMCVAHCDTIIRKDGVELMLDPSGNILTNAKGVLGADDRAGVACIMEAIEDYGHRPYVLFTTGEESGGTGVKAFVADRHLDDHLDRVNFFIEIDRQGSDDYVYYSDVLPQAIHAWAKKHGWTEANGSYSDVADLTSHYGIPHINVSAGYYNQHGKNEKLHIDECHVAMARLTECLNDPPERIILTPDERERSYHRYKGSPYVGGRAYGGYGGSYGGSYGYGSVGGDWWGDDYVGRDQRPSSKSTLTGITLSYEDWQDPDVVSYATIREIVVERMSNDDYLDLVASLEDVFTAQSARVGMAKWIAGDTQYKGRGDRGKSMYSIDDMIRDYIGIRATDEARWYAVAHVGQGYLIDTLDDDDDLDPDARAALADFDRDRLEVIDNPTALQIAAVDPIAPPALTITKPKPKFFGGGFLGGGKKKKKKKAR